MKTGVDCPFCADCYLEANAFSFLIADLRQSYARLARNQYKRGYTVVALKRHVNELFELSSVELTGFWQDVADVARALDAIYQPVKMNYAVLGNLCPHVHCHLVPQFVGDRTEDALRTDAGDIRLSPAEYQRVLLALRERLVVERGGV